MINKKNFYIAMLLVFFSFNALYAKNDYFSEGQKLYNQKKYSKSKFKFEKDIVFNTKSEKSYLYLAKIYKQQNNDEFQESNLNKVNFYPCIPLLGLLQKYLNKFQQVLQ